MLFRSDKKVAAADDIRVEVWITDARVALACSTYDKGGTWYGGVTALALTAGERAVAAVRRRGKMLVGQVRYPWISRVGSTAKFGWLTDERVILRFKDPDGDVWELYLTLPKRSDAAELAAEVARRAAAYRLSSDPDPQSNTIAALQELLGAERRPGDPANKNVIKFHVFPTFFAVGETSARFLPLGASRDRLRQAHVDVVAAGITSPVVTSPPRLAGPPGNATASRGPVPARNFCAACGAALSGTRFCTACGREIRLHAGPAAGHSGGQVAEVALDSNRGGPEA